MKANNSSPGFPFKSVYGNINSSNTTLSNSNSNGLLPKLRINCNNEYNNETPDFFRINSMVQSPSRYHNPFLNEVINQDCNDYYKILQRSRSQIAMIDSLKSSRLLSQDKVLLRKIKNENNKICLSPISSLVTSSPLKELSLEHKDYSTKLRKLDMIYSQKIPFKLSPKIDKNTLINLGEDREGIKCSRYDKNNIERIKMAFEPRKSSYLKNMCSYDIKENEKINTHSLVHLERNEEIIYNPILDKTSKVKPDVFINEKWNNINETYMLLLDENNLKRKGGLFSEYINKNKISHEMINLSKGKNSILIKNRLKIKG